MASERLDLRSARYDTLARSVMIDGRDLLVEVTQEALEALARKALSPKEAVIRAVSESKRLVTLLKRLPADDGKITITLNILMNDGLFGEEKGE